MSVVAEDISVNFGGLQALENVGIEVPPGQVTALIGPNGAGKSTLLNVLSGFVKPSAGSILVDEVDITREPAHRRSSNGIARSFQTPRFVPHLSVFENVLAGFYPTARPGVLGALIGGGGHERTMRARTHELIEEFSLGGVADIAASNVPLWQLRIMEIARCMASGPRYVFLDEPAAGFDESECRLLGDQILKLRDQQVGVLLVEHNFGFIKSVSTHVTVVAQGRHLAEGEPHDIEKDPRVVEVYLGGEEH